MDINILEIILSFHKTLYDLILLNDNGDTTGKFECRDCIESAGIENKVCMNKHGTTRCFSTTNLFLDTILFEKKAVIKSRIYNNSDKIVLDLTTHIPDIIIQSDLIKINIRPDHVFYLYKIKSEWYLLSSWIYLYNFNILKIEDITDFLSLLNMFFYMNNKKNIDSKYQDFLQKYFMYKYSIAHNSIFITKDIKTLFYSLNNIIDDNFIQTDYYGNCSLSNCNHQLVVTCYKMEEKDVISTFIEYFKLYYNIYFEIPIDNIKSSEEIDKMADTFNLMKKYFLNKIYYNYDNAIYNIIFKIDDKYKLKYSSSNNKLNYNNIIEKYSVVLENFYYLFNMIFDSSNTLILKEPSQSINDMNDMNTIIIHYGEKLVKLIDDTKDKYGFITGGSYNLNKFKPDIKVTQNLQNPNNLYFNNYNLINKSITKTIISTNSNFKYTGEYRYDSFYKFCQNKENITKILKTQNIIISIDTRTYVITKSHINIKEPDTNVILILCEVDNKLIETVSNLDYMCDNIFTCYKLYNTNLYITNYNKTQDDKIKVGYIDNNYNEYEKIKGQITAKITSLTGSNTYDSNNNTNFKFLIDIYSYKHKNALGIDNDDILTINNLLTYFKFYAKKSYENKQYLYIPYLDNEFVYNILIKKIYINFVQFNYNYNKYIIEMGKMLLIKSVLIKENQTNKNIAINGYTITNKKLNTFATNGVTNVLFNINSYSIFILLLYKTITNYLSDYKENTDYIIVFNGCIILNILIKLNYQKYNNLSNIGIMVDNTNNFGLNIYINKNKIRASDEINKLKIRIYECMSLIKNKLNFNKSNSKFNSTFDAIPTIINTEFRSYCINNKLSINFSQIDMEEHDDYFITPKQEQYPLKVIEYLMPNYYFLCYNHFNYANNSLLPAINYDLIELKLNFKITLEKASKDSINIESDIISILIKEIKFTPEFLSIFNKENKYSSIYNMFNKDTNIENPLLFTKAENKKNLSEDYITFYTIEYSINDLYIELFLQSVFPWLADNMMQKLNNLISLLFITDNTIIDKIVTNIDKCLKSTDVYTASNVSSNSANFYSPDKLPTNCYTNNMIITDCVDCLNNNIKNLYKINNSGSEVYSIIYDMYYKKALISYGIKDYTFGDWQTNFIAIIDRIRRYIGKIKIHLHKNTFN